MATKRDGRGARRDPGSVIPRLPGLKLSLVRERWIRTRQPPLIRSRAALAAALAAGLPEDDPRERFIMALVDHQRRLLGLHTVAIGHLTGVLVDFPGILRLALLAEAAFIGVGHNHCSGDPTPSHFDDELTHKLTRAAALLDIVLLDHIVFGRGMRWMSLVEWAESGEVRHRAVQGAWASRRVAVWPATTRA